MRQCRGVHQLQPPRALTQKPAQAANDRGGVLGLLADARQTVLDPLSLLVTGPADGSTLARVSRWCEEHDVLPESLSLGTRSLEDVFLELTGRELSA